MNIEIFSANNLTYSQHGCCSKESQAKKDKRFTVKDLIDVYQEKAIMPNTIIHTASGINLSGFL
jgi:hypothetical protein